MASHPQNIPLHIQLEWYKIRDMFFGLNGHVRNIPMALELAKKCTHPDAVWLASVCNAKTRSEARLCFEKLTDARAICFGWMCRRRVDFMDDSCLPLLQAANLGFAFAQSSYACQSHDFVKKFKYAQLAANQGERDGYFGLGHFYYRCGMDIAKSKQNFIVAANLGCNPSMSFLGYMLGDYNPERWYWWGLVARKGNDPGIFLSHFVEPVCLFNAGKVEIGNTIFAIGRALHGHVDSVHKTVFGNGDAIERYNIAQQAIEFYQMQLQAYRKAVDEWTKAGMRFKVVKDIRKFIAQLVWNTRGEALYTLASTPLNNV